MRFFFIVVALLLGLPVVWPHVDLIVSNWFFRPQQGFFLADTLPFTALHWLAFDGARVMGVVCLVAASIAFMKHRSIRGMTGKGWLFLLLALLIGPGLIANVVLKDHWGRARPHEIVEFGGDKVFTPALEPHFENAHTNGSFVCGDGAFGFYLASFAYVVSRRRSRVFFWSGMAIGCLFCVARIAQGGHFFSDSVYAAFFMLLSSAILHIFMYGKNQTRECWRLWFSSKAV